MVKILQASIFLAFFTFTLLFYSGGAQTSFCQGQKTWCVAKPSADEAALTSNLNYACSQADCSTLQRECAYTNSLFTRASLAMNLYYQVNGRNTWNCYFSNSGIISITDPSTDQCAFV